MFINGKKTPDPAGCFEIIIFRKNPLLLVGLKPDTILPLENTL